MLQGSTSWQSRLLIGKVGHTAAILLKTITQFGTNPGPGEIVTQPIPHATNHMDPLPGYTIQFFPPGNMVDEKDTWFGVCCSDIHAVTVFGVTGPGCLVQWLDQSHYGTWSGSPATFYELLPVRKPELLTSMRKWGHMLVYDPESHLFVSLVEDQHVSYFESYSGDHAEEILARANEQAKYDETHFGREDHMIFEALFETAELYFVDANGAAVNPSKCAPDSIGCVW